MRQVDSTDLRTVSETILEALGATPTIACDVADHLVEADLRGHGSHGVRMIPIYASLVDDGTLAPDATPTVDSLTTGCAHVDGRRSFGQVAGRTAVEHGIELASDGIALTGIGNTTHLGRIGAYGERAAEAGLLFIAFANVPVTDETGPVAPLGSAEGRLGTNPVCVAIPGFDALPHPIVLDMATSQVAIGKIRRAAAMDEPLAPEWVISGDDDVTDAATFLESEAGSILPLGGRTTGHKGFGLAVVVELLGALVGDGFTSGQSDVDWGNGAAFFLADPTVFSTPQAIEERLQAFATHLEETEYDDAVATGPSTRADRGTFPGWPEYRAAEVNRRDGVSIPCADLAELGELAAELGVDDVVPDPWLSG